MRTAAKVFIWIGMIVQFFLIYPIVIGSLALKKINNVKSAKELQDWGIATIFLCSFIGGIFMLNIKDTETDDKDIESTRLITNTRETIETGEQPLISSTGAKAIKIISLSIAIVVLCLFVFLIFFSLFGLTELDDILKINIIEWGNVDRQYETYDRMLSYTKTNIVSVCIQIPIAICGIVWFCLSKKRSNLYLSIVFLVCSIINFGFLLGNICPYWWTLYDWYVETVDIISVINLILLCALSIFSFIVAMLTKKTKKIRIEIKKAVNNMECELNEAKMMFEHSVISQEEYQSIRTSIINKYYK